MDKNVKVAVLMGGVGSEREISLLSGENIATALEDDGLEIVRSDIGPDELDILDDRSIDVFFPALHGEFGEDGKLQAIFEARGLKFVGSGSRTSRLAMDKIASRNIFRDHGVPVPDYVEVSDVVDHQELGKKLGQLGEILVVKPVRQGSSIGIEIIEGTQNAVEACQRCLVRFGDCMVEEFLDGREITVGILNGEPLPITEIKSKTAFYDYQAKYLDETTEYLFDTIPDEKLTVAINRTAVTCFESLGCRHLGRVDMILSSDEEPVVLELNTMPGFTSHSLVPMAANKAGITTSSLCVKLIETAIEG